MLNKFECIDTASLTVASRTYEVILVTSPEGKQKVVYVYNHDGQYFSLFLTLDDLLLFITDGVKADASKNEWERESFDNEEDLDGFLETMVVE